MTTLCPPSRHRAPTCPDVAMAPYYTGSALWFARVRADLAAQGHAIDAAEWLSWLED